jgi:hypothetical protein
MQRGKRSNNIKDDIIKKTCIVKTSLRNILYEMITNKIFLICRIIWALTWTVGLIRKGVFNFSRNTIIASCWM